MPLLLITVGVVFAALLFLNNLIKTFSRTPKVGFWDLMLAFSVTLIPLAALIANESLESPEFLITQIALPLGAGIAASNLLVILLELFRPQRLKGSRGLLGITAGILIAFSTFTVPIVAVYTNPQTSSTTVASAGSSTQTVSTQDPNATLDPTRAAEEARIRFGDLFRQVIAVVVTATHVDQAVIIHELELGKPLSEVVVENGGSVDQVVDGITLVMQEAIRDSERRGSLNRLQAAIAISQMELLVRIAVNSDINTLGRQLGRPTPAPGEPTEPSFSSLLTDLPPQTADSAAAVITDTPQPAFTVTATHTPTETPEPSATRTPTMTRTPRPTETPYPTLERYATRTPTPTATLPTPCIASVDYNLRVRSSPEVINTPDNTLATVPYGSTLELYGKSADGLWWYTSYEGAQGWVMGEYMTLSAACDRLPVRNP
ncbi:MAG: hypothetical protein U0670_11480 [Anaerolineae bacterium]